MAWFHYFLAALQTLAQVEPAVASLFHGGAANTATKIGSALQIVNAMSTDIAAGMVPATPAPADVHPDLVTHALSLAGPGASAT